MPDNVTISEDYRNLTVPQPEQVLGCVGDAWVRRVSFEAPRYCDGTDMSDFQFSVHFVNNGGGGGVWVADDVEAGEDTVAFTWLVSPVACEISGTTKVSVRASLLDGDEVVKQFNSAVYNWSVLPSNNTDLDDMVVYYDPIYQFVDSLIAEYNAVTDAVYTTPSGTTSSIAVPVQGYSPDTDVLFVNVEGLALMQGVDYTLSGSSIVLSTPITHEGTKVGFRVMSAARLQA